MRLNLSHLGGACRIQEEWHAYDATTQPAVSLLAFSPIQSSFHNPSFFILLFNFYCSPFTSAPPVFGPSCPPVTAAAGWIGGLDPSLHTRVCVARLYCECPTHTEFRYIEAHSSRCQWCFCGKLAMSPLYSGFPLINQPSGKPSLSASTSLVLSLPWMGVGGGGRWEKEGQRLLGFYFVFLTWSDTLMLCCGVV